MLFKTQREEKEFNNAPISLVMVANEFVRISLALGILPICTRILAPILGESGVHLDYRAIDFRDEQGVGGPRLYTSEQVSALVKGVSQRFPRKDGKQTIIHHAFLNHADINSRRAPYHFHLQIAPQAKFSVPDWWR